MSSTWFVTGASRGFGRELTDQLLARGDRVAATLRRPEQLADLAAAHGDRLWVRALDVTTTAQLREVVDAAFTELGRIDVVVSNAGYGVFGAAEALSDTQIDVLIATNLTGCIQLARAVAPHLRAQGGGRILQMSSMGGLIGFPGFALYHATKWGIEGFFEAFAPEVEPFGIRTTLVEPGMIRTSFYEAAQRAPELEAYANNPAIRRGDTRLEDMPGDQAKVIHRMGVQE
jgi:NAD(P)-dependent dehydrogenase (short-subunit alcohol dehydrogenase family)